MENIAMSVVVVSKDSLQEQMRDLFGEFSGFPDEDRDACEDLLTSGKFVMNFPSKMGARIIEELLIT